MSQPVAEPVENATSTNPGEPPIHTQDEEAAANVALREPMTSDANTRDAVAEPIAATEHRANAAAGDTTATQGNEPAAVLADASVAAGDEQLTDGKADSLPDFDADPEPSGEEAIAEEPVVAEREDQSATAAEDS
eukprot:3502152-Amphidinium_carterae.1